MTSGQMTIANGPDSSEGNPGLRSTSDAFARKALRRCFVVAVFSAILSGCSYLPIERTRTSTSADLNDSPLVIDGAMQAREWDRSTALYPNGGTQAGPTLFAYRSVPSNVPLGNATTETPVFVAQILALPLNAFLTPPWQMQMYNGVLTPPTYNAMPSLPPTQAVMTPAAAVPTTQP